MRLIANQRNRGIIDPFFNFLDQVPTTSFYKKQLELRNNSAPMNIIEKDDVYNIEVSVPGWTKDEIEITLEQDTLKISGKREQVSETETSDKVHLKEFSQETFYRSIIVGKNIVKNEIQADIKDGVLTLVLPKAEKAQTNEVKKIEIS
ncbi:Hsp20/alpha crystallin family protein [Membranihabitans marinus]|uniref:Hsp20/alpha crystallin family protein n=1 Tax=Membranihabitans marinus TaxID=1227546 RepID=UPI001F2C3731|nr:Hsp20/alpha crystallin family protein [Membranihabitans marinus]